MNAVTVVLPDTDELSVSTLSRVLVVIPAYNEAASIRRVLQEVRSSLPGVGIVVIDDASDDDTAAIVVDEGIPVLRLPFNLGVGGAMRTGFLYAREHDWDVVVQVDADGQHDPAFVPAMLAELQRGADLVVGARFAGVGSYRVTRVRRVTMVAVSTLMSWTCGTRLTDATSGLRAANRETIELFAKLYPAEYLGDTLQSLVIAKRANLVIRQIPVDMRQRSGGEPSQGLLGSVLYLLRCTFAIAVRKQSQGERRWLSQRVEQLP